MSNNDSNTPIPKKFKDLKDDDLFNILKFIAYDKKTSRSFASINKNTNEVYKNKIDIAKKENKEEAYDPEDIHPAFGEKVLIEPELLLDFLFKYYNYNPHQQEQFDDENIKYFNNLKALYNENKFDEIKNIICKQTITNNIYDFTLNISKINKAEQCAPNSIDNENYNKVATLLSGINEEVRNKIKVKYTFNIYNTHDNLLYYAKSDKKQYDDYEIVLDFGNYHYNITNFDVLFNTYTNLKKDKKFVLAAVKKDGSALQYASDELKNDREIVLAAVKQNPAALEFASDALKNDQEFILQVINQKDDYDYIKNEETYNNVIKFAKKIKKTLYALQNTSNNLKNNKEVVMAAIKECSTALLNLEIYHTKLDDKLYALRKINNIGDYKARDLIDKDKNYVLNDAKQEAKLLFNYVSNELKEDKKFIKELVKEAKNISCITNSQLSLKDKAHLYSINLIGERATKVLIFTAIITLIAIPIICTLIALGLNRDTIRKISKSVKNLEIQEKVANFTKSFG